MKKISIIGAGSWGTALAAVASENGYHVSLWGRDSHVVNEINTHHVNGKYFPQVLLDPRIVAYSSLKEAIQGQKIIVLAVPSSSIKQICEEIKPQLTNEIAVIHVAKGFDTQNQKTMSQIIKECLHCPVGTLSGPSHAEEVIHKMPTTVVAASEYEWLSDQMQEIWMNDYFRIYPSRDLLGVELGGSLKNIIAVASGLLEGLGYGDNARAALITRGLSEITKLALAMGADSKTLQGLSGIGDLIVTATSKLSRNYQFGKYIGEGYSADQAKEKIKMVVEGVNATKNGYELARRMKVDMPIVSALYRVLFEDKDPKDEAEQLMKRPKKQTE